MARSRFISIRLGSDEDVNRSVIAQEFLNAFVYGTAVLPDGAVDRER